MKKLLVLIIFLLFLTLSLAQGYFQKIYVIIDLEQDIAKETYFVSLTTTEDITGLTFQLPVKPENIILEDLNYKVQQIEDNYFLIIDKSIPRNTDFSFNFSFETSEILTKIRENEYLVNFVLSPPSRVTDFRLKIILPKESSIIEKSGTLLISRPVDISTDGKRIFLGWTKSLSEDEQFAAFVQYKTNIRQDNLQTIIIFILALILIFFIGYKLKSFKKEKIIEQVLSDDEKKIVKYIKEKGEILQEELKIHLDWSKTKVSKIVRNLEAKQIIVKTPYKKTNKLKLR